METNRDDFAIAVRSAFLQKGAKQKFSLFFLLVLSFFVIFLDSINSSSTTYVKKALNDGVYRASYISSIPGKFFSNSIDGVKNIFFVYRENKEIKDELIALRSEAKKKVYLITENNILRQVLDQKISSNYNTTNAKVILDKGGSFIKSILINKGTKHKIKKGLAVTSNSNFIGVVVETNFFSSRVLLLSDLNSKIPIMISPSGENAILAGTGKDIPNLIFLPKNSKIKEGDLVFTSGKDGILKAGMPIGKIVNKIDSFGTSLFTDTDQLYFVDIILDE